MGTYSAIFISLCLLAATHIWRPQKLASEKIFNPPPLGLLDYTLGYNDLLSSLFWVRVVQDMEVCNQKRKILIPRTNLEAGIDPILAVVGSEKPTAKCEKGWVYQMIDLVTNLDTSFKAAYKIGGTFLSVLVDDREGASLIYDKAVAHYPKDWEVLYFAAAHQMFEMKNPKKAAVLLERAGKAGAPLWVYSLAAGLYTHVGQAQFAKSILEAVLARDPKGAMVDRLRIRLRKINALLKKEGENPESGR